MSKFNRRAFLRTTGMVAGVSTVSGLASAEENEQEVESDVEPAPIEIVDRISIDTGKDTGFAAAKAMNTETGETGEAIIEFDRQPVAAHVAEPGATKRLRERKEADVTTQRGWYELITEEIPNKADNLITRAATYGTTFESCSGISGYGDHQMAGVSMEYYEALNKYGSTVLGAAIGGVLTFVATSYTGPGAVVMGVLGAILGGAVGTIVGLALGSLKDSNVLTLTATDWGICAYGACQPGIMLQGSGVWRDTVKDQYVLWLHEGDHLRTY